MSSAIHPLEPWTWDDFSRTEKSSTSNGSARALVLDRNGWLAMLAFLAGPSWVTREPAPGCGAQPAVGDDVGLAPGGDDDDDTIVHAEMTSYLEAAGIPRPPWGTRRRLHLPEGLSAAAFESARHEAASRVPPGEMTAQASAVLAAVRRMLPLSGA